LTPLLASNSPGFSWYDLWYPVDSDRYGTARASPSFVAYLFVAEAVGGSGQSRIALVDVPAHPQLAVYAVWDAAHGAGVSRLAVLNLSPRNQTTSAKDAAAVVITLDLSELIGANATKAQVKRMQAPGLDSKVWSNLANFRSLISLSELQRGNLGGAVVREWGPARQRDHGDVAQHLGHCRW
jgi:hypothetical protein